MCLISTEDTKHIPVIPGLSTSVGTMIYTGSIGTQIANEHADSYRCVCACVRLGSASSGEAHFTLVEQDELISIQRSPQPVQTSSGEKFSDFPTNKPECE